MHYENGTFVAPTEAKLEHLMPGCFVRVEAGKTCFWAEIDEKQGEGKFRGSIRHELNTSECGQQALGFKRAEFHTKHIIALGCDVFCSC